MDAIFEETSWVGDFRAKLDSIIFIKIDKNNPKELRREKRLHRISAGPVVRSFIYFHSISVLC